MAKRTYIDNKFRITVGLNQEMQKKIDAICEERELNYNQFLREVLRQYFKLLEQGQN